MKRAILWCGQVLKGRTLGYDPNEKRPTDKEKLRAEGNSDALLPYDDFCLQFKGLELAYRAARGLGVPESEIHACLVDPDLQPRDLRTEVRRATRNDLERLIGEIAGRSDPTDALLFIAVNHGSPDGLTTAEDVSDPMRDDEDTILTPGFLEQCLGPLGGAQVLVICTCYAGVFLRLGGPNRKVLTACSESETYLVPRSDCVTSPFLDEIFGAWCGCTQNDAVPTTRLPLDEAFSQAKERMSGTNGLRTPHAAGSAAWPVIEARGEPSPKRQGRKPRPAR